MLYFYLDTRQFESHKNIPNLSLHTSLLQLLSFLSFKEDIKLLVSGVCFSWSSLSTIVVNPSKLCLFVHTPPSPFAPLVYTLTPIPPFSPSFHPPSSLYSLPLLHLPLPPFLPPPPPYVLPLTLPSSSLPLPPLSPPLFRHISYRRLIHSFCLCR